MDKLICIPPRANSWSTHIFIFAFLYSTLIIAFQLSLVESCSPDLNTCSHLYSHQHQKNSKHHQHSSAYEHLFDHELTFESRNCFCDKHCKTYRDCCSDYDRVAPQENRNFKEPQLENVKYADLLFDCNLYIYDKDATSNGNFKVNGAYSINKCTVPETSDEQREIADKCVTDVIPSGTNFADLNELNTKLKEHDPLLLLPVTIKQHGNNQPLTYRNIYCAVCNNVSLSTSDMKKIEFWQLGASCVSESPKSHDENAGTEEAEKNESAPSVKDRNCVISYRKGNDHSMKSMKHNGVRKCKFSKNRCVEDRDQRKLGDPSFTFDLEELDSMTRNCHSSQALRYQGDLRFRNQHCAMCHNVETKQLRCEPKNLIQDFSQLLAKTPAFIDLSYENNRVLLNQSSYRTVIETDYSLEKRIITFINHLEQQQPTSHSETDSSEQNTQQATGKSVKELQSYSHVLYWKGLPASASSLSPIGFRTFVIYLSTVYFIYLFL